MHLDPKPGGSSGSTTATPIYQTPDFILHKQGDKLDVQLSYKTNKRLRPSSYYTQLLHRMQKTKALEPRNRETLRFIKSKSEAAHWFIQALQQRADTLLGTARIIIEQQRAFLLSGDPMQLRPLILVDVADRLKVDVSTISRIVNNKRIQTLFGIFSLRYFFSQSVSTQGTDEVSNRVVQTYLQQLIQEENKSKPFSDEALSRILKSKGYLTARRTVTKYRELLRIPVARLRKQW